MLRRVFLTVMLLIAMPALASAWILPVTVKNTTAGINAGNKTTITFTGAPISPANVVSAGTTYFYPASTVTTVSVAIANIENVESITLDGTVLPRTSPVTITKGAVNQHSLTIAYSAVITSPVRTVTLTQATGGLTSLKIGGVVSTTSGFTNVPVGTSVEVTAQPNVGFKFSKFTVNGSDDLNGAGRTSPVTKFFQVNGTFTPNAVTALFEVDQKITSATLSVPLSGTVGTRSLATANATSTVTPINYAYTTTCSNESQAAGTNNSFSFTPNNVGACTVTVTVTAGTSVPVVKTATMTVISAATAGNYSCVSCHANSSPAIVALYNGSAHVTGAFCQDCHTSNSAHAGLPANTVCTGCHGDSPANHPVEIAQACALCHNPHSLVAVSAGNLTGAPHFNNLTGGKYPASYMTSKADCTSCHASGATNKTIRKQWAKSGHAATTALPWTDYDFKTKLECVRCHTTTGFIAYSTAKVTAAWGVALDMTKEVLICAGCHSNVAAGTVRTVSPNKPFADDPDYTNRNVGLSNICMDCHSGRNNGKSIQKYVDVYGVFNTPSFDLVSPHYLTAGGSLHGKSAYHFPNRTYADYSSNSHRKIGMADNNATGSSGPCAACHMSAANKHAFKVVSSASGAIVTITTPICTNCHKQIHTNTPTMPATALDAKWVEFDTALEVLRIQLKDKGFRYSPDYPYFGSFGQVLNWGSGQDGANVMGAAFNYKLFLSEPGAYAHNPAYAKQLIIDSIDAAFNNGTITGDIASALNDLYGKGLITDDQRTSINTYKNPEITSCTSCHGNPPNSGTHTEISVTAGMCTDCHIYTGTGGVHHNDRNLDIIMSCTSCHGNPPTTQKFHASGAVGYTHNPAANHTDCSVCHVTPATTDKAAPHRNTIVELKTNATACSLCHGYPSSDNSAHVVSAASSATCTDCHNYTNYNASTHNNGTVDTKALACKNCHPTLAASGAHSAHIGDLINTVTFYNFTGNYSTESIYRFGCSNCHPTNTAMHRNGTVEITLMPNANSGSLRNKNTGVTDEGLNVAGSGLAGTTKVNVVCSATYCHSNGAVGDSLTFAPSPDWYGGSFSGDKCAKCHGNSPATGAHAIHVVGIHYDSVSKGSGAFGNMSVVRTHGDPTQSTTLNCNTCHFDTVSYARNKNNAACVQCHTSDPDNSGLARITNHAKHVNGFVDISFTSFTSFRSKAQLRDDSFAQYTSTYWKRNGGNYKNGTQAYDISKFGGTPAWNVTGDTCSNVVCHMGIPVQWKSKEVECYDCHKGL